MKKKINECDLKQYYKENKTMVSNFFKPNRKIKDFKEFTYYKKK